MYSRRDIYIYISGCNWVVELLSSVSLSLQSCPTLQILFDFCGIFAIKSFKLLIEFSISRVDIINVSLRIMCSSPRVLSSLLNPTIRGTIDEKQPPTART